MAKGSCLLLEDTFDDYSSQKVGVIIPKSFKIGENKIKVVLEKTNIPSGFMLTSIFDLIKFDGIKKPEFLSGYPISSLIIKEKGEYDINLKVNLVYKTSCGGIQFSNLLNKNIKFNIN